MKCPKCGFNSFEYYDNCKKCSGDLISYKHNFSITSLILPLEAKGKLASSYHSADNTLDMNDAMPETHDDIFSFDLPADPASSTHHNNGDPFNFDNHSSPQNQPNSSISEDDVFSDLLESTSQAEVPPFGAARVIKPPNPPVKAQAEPSTGPGEFDLESFAWDDNIPTAAPQENTETTDDFDTLFGSPRSDTKK